MRFCQRVFNGFVLGVCYKECCLGGFCYMGFIVMYLSPELRVRHEFASYGVLEPVTPSSFHI